MLQNMVQGRSLCVNVIARGVRLGSIVLALESVVADRISWQSDKFYYVLSDISFMSALQLQRWSRASFTALAWVSASVSTHKYTSTYRQWTGRLKTRKQTSTLRSVDDWQAFCNPQSFVSRKNFFSVVKKRERLKVFCLTRWCSFFDFGRSAFYGVSTKTLFYQF